MKKNILSIAALVAFTTLGAQVRIVNNTTNLSVANSPAFIDASSNPTVNNSTNVGKGLIFPRVDLTAMTAFPSVTAGIPNSFPTRFDGMIVYNTASSGTAGVGSTTGNLTPGYWFYENKSSTNAGGIWKPMGNIAATAVEPWYNAANNTAATSNTQDIYQLGKVGIGVSSPNSKLDVVADNNWISAAFSSTSTAYGNSTSPAKVVIGNQSDVAIIGAHDNALNTWADLAINPSVGNIGVGTFKPIAKLEVKTTTRWISSAFSSNSIADGNTLTSDKVVIGSQSNVAVIGAHDSGLNTWADLAINPSIGNVGVGTYKPIAKLDVQSTTKWISSAFSSNSIADGNNATTNKVVIGSQSNVAVIGAHDSGLNTWADLAINPSIGNVGVGTYKPIAKLDVQSTTKWISSAFSSTYAGDGNSATTNKVVIGSQSNVAVIGAHDSGLNTWADLAINPSIGNVGLGTYKPIAKLDVQSTTRWISSAFSSTYAGDGNTSTPDKVVIGNQSNIAIIGAHDNGLNTWANLAINPSTGNVGVGTFTPNTKLDVSTSTKWFSASFSSTSTADGNNATPDKVVIGNQSNVAVIGAHNNALNAWSNLVINPNAGNVGIGTYAPTSKLHVEGNVFISGTVTTSRVQGPSDRRFKKDIAPIMNPTDKLNLLNGYTYTWRDKKDFPGQALGEGEDMGVIAQEVEKVFPVAVMTNKDGYKSVNYNALIPLLIEALKESNQRIRVLEARVDASTLGNSSRVSTPSSVTSNKQTVTQPSESNQKRKKLYDGTSTPSKIK